MKKILAFALSIAAIGYAGAQKNVVKQASKLAGKTDKIEEARSLIKQAIANPETQNSADTYMTAGDIEWKALDAGNLMLALNPEAEVDLNKQAEYTLNGYNYYLTALPLSLQPNEKGKVSDKTAKKIYSLISDHANDFRSAGITFYNSNKYYPEAYTAFKVYADIDGDPNTARSKDLQEPDTTRAYFYFLSGVSAYSGDKIDEAREAFLKAVQNNYNSPDGYKYAIACWEVTAQRDSARTAEADKEILALSKAGFDKFGLAEPWFLSSVIDKMHANGDIAGAFALLNEQIAANPNNATLLGLRGWLNGVSGNKDAAEKDYRLAAAQTDVTSNTLLNGAKELYVIGSNKLGAIEGNTAEARQQRLAVKTDYLEPALEMIQRAKALSTDNQELSLINNILDNIEYSLQTYF